MILGLFIGISIGFALSAIWRALIKLIFTAQNKEHLIEPEPVVQIGPFLHKKPKAKRKPVSNTDEDVFKREMQNAGKML